MDMPPPVEINQVIPSSIEESTPEEYIKYYVLDRIDGPDIPNNVKQFAKDNNCIEVMKQYYWRYKKYKGYEAYSCGINGKLKFILEKDNKLQFANWYETYRINKSIY